MEQKKREIIQGGRNSPIGTVIIIPPRKKLKERTYPIVRKPKIESFNYYMCNHEEITSEVLKAFNHRKAVQLYEMALCSRRIKEYYLKKELKDH